MTKNYILENLPIYKNVIADQPVLPNQNFEPIVADNIFSKQEIDYIYKIVNNTPEEQKLLQKWAGHKAWQNGLGDMIANKITSKAQQYLDEKIILSDYSFARYSPTFGYKCKLFPHYDTRPSQRITFDIQLKSSEPWGIVVEGKKYYLNDNQALIFAGTQQMHWREKKDLAPDAEIDMIFCHFQFVNDKPLLENQLEILENRSWNLMEETGINNNIEEYGI